MCRGVNGREQEHPRKGTRPRKVVKIYNHNLLDWRASMTYCRDSDEVSERGADLFAQLAKSTLTSHGRFTIALSARATAMALYARLGSGTFKKNIDWSNVHMFWTDSGCNRKQRRGASYEMLEDVLLSRIPIPKRNVYPAPAENADCQRATAEYEQTLRAFFALEAGQLPRFDLITLEMAPDGHVASLFPGSNALAETARLVATTYVHRLNEHRITLTPPVIGNAANVMLLAVGKGSASKLRETLTGEHQPERLPSQLIRPTNGNLYYFVDQMAARKLPTNVTQGA
jgi:6-phosphogluconolactonase